MTRGSVHYSIIARGRGLLVLVSGICLLGCGGAQVKLSPCEQAYEDLASKTEAETCSEILYNNFETKVSEWRESCTAPVMVARQGEISKKLQNAQICTDNRRQREVLMRSCKGRLKQMTEGQQCIGDECEGAVADMTRIAKSCDVPVLNGALTKDIEKATVMITERFEEGENLRALSNLIVMCDSIYEVQTQKEARIRLNEIIEGIEVTKPMFQKTIEGTEVDRFKKGGVESCNFALEEVMKKITDVSDEEIAQYTSSAKRQKRHVQRYQRMGKRLAMIHGKTIFPKQMAALTDLMKRYGAQASEYTFADPPPLKPAPERVKKEPIKKPATETGKAAAMTDGTKLSNADVKKCKSLEKKLKHFTAKFTAYEKKGNTSKSNAYKAKQEKAQEKWDTIGCSDSTS